MALTAREIIQAARDEHPAFTEQDHPDVVLLRRLVRAENDLLSLALTRKRDLISSDYTFLVHPPAEPPAPPADPVEPLGLTATPMGPSRVDLGWLDTNEGRYGYEIRRDGVLIATVQGGTASYSDRGATPATTHIYEVRTVGMTVGLTISATTPTAPPIPIQPESLVATASGPTTVSLGWLDTNQGAFGYEIRRGAVLLATLPAGSNAYTDSAAAPQTTYTYEVRTVGMTVGPRVTVTTPAVPVEPAVSPTDLTATAQTQTRVLLGWTDTNAGRYGYEIRRNGVLLTTTAPGASSYIDAAAVANTDYTYEVRTVGTTTGPTATVTTPDYPRFQPANLQGSAAGPNRIDLSWTDTNSGVWAYEVYRGGVLISTTAKGANSFRDTGVSAETTYTYEVRTVGMVSGPTVVVTTPLEPPVIPTSFLATVVSATRVDLAWTDTNAGRYGYEIRRNSVLIHTTAPGAASYSDTSASPGTSYTYEVRTVGMTSGRTAAVTTPTIAPVLPSDFQAHAAGPNRVDLFWVDTNAGRYGYQIRRGGVLIHTTAAGVNTYADNTVSAGTTYNYELRTVGMTSGRSAVVTTPGAGSLPAPKAGDRILFDTRTSLQAASTEAAAKALFGYTSDNMHFTTSVLGTTRAMRADYTADPGTCEDSGARLEIDFSDPRPKEVYIQYKTLLGRTATGGGVGTVGQFQITNANCGNAGAKRLLVSRDLPDDGALNRLDFIWPGPAPTDCWLVSDHGGLSQHQNRNLPTYNPQEHVGEVMTWTLYYKPESAEGAGDGIARLWLGDKLFIEVTDGGFGHQGFRGFGLPTTFRSPQFDQSEYFWDILAWEPAAARAPLIDLDFEKYADTAALRADTPTFAGGVEDLNITDIHLDTAGGYQGRAKAMRYDFGAIACGSKSVGRAVNLPHSTKEIWVEAALKWTVGFGEYPHETCAPAAHKLLFGGVTPDLNGRWAVHFGQGGQELGISAEWAGNEGDTPPFDDALQFFDGKWHNLRVHWKHSTTGTSADGVYELWMDGRLVYSKYDLNTPAGTSINSLALGRNKDKGRESGNASVYWGMVKAWDVNPNWAPPAVQPLIDVDFQKYADTAALLADHDEAGGPWIKAEDINTSEITLDTTTGYGSSDRSMKYTFQNRTGSGSRCLDYTRSRSLLLPPGMREVWIEVVTKFSGNFNTKAPEGWGCSSSAAYKFLFAMVNPDNRFGLYNGIFGAGTWDADYPGAYSEVPEGMIRLNRDTQWDGTWHTHRVHWRLSTDSSATDGIFRWWIDGVLVANKAIKTRDQQGSRPLSDFYGIALGRNLNQGPAQEQTLHWGRIRVWNGDPGW